MPRGKNSKPKSGIPEPLSCIQQAAQLTLEWAAAGNLQLLRVEPVTPAVHIHKRFSVWLFYATDKVLREYEANGNTQKIEDAYLSNLKKLKCAEEYLEGVLFFADSDENVQRFAGLKPIQTG